MKLSLVVAMDRNGLIGKGGELPWPRIAEDMRLFRDLTMGRALVAGRITAEALPPRCLSRLSIVSRSLMEGPPSRMEDGGAVAFGDPLAALSEACRMDWTRGPVCVGGTTLYRAYQGLFGEAHVTRIDEAFEGDTYFPFRLLDSPEWEPAAEPRVLTAGVTYHHLRRAR